MKKINEVRLHEIVKGAIMDFVNESGKTKRGRYMMGRLLKRAEDSGKDDLADELRGRCRHSISLRRPQSLGR